MKRGMNRKRKNDEGNYRKVKEAKRKNGRIETNRTLDDDDARRDEMRFERRNERTQKHKERIGEKERVIQTERHVKTRSMGLSTAIKTTRRVDVRINVLSFSVPTSSTHDSILPV